jgi:hypothetical protein
VQAGKRVFPGATSGSGSIKAGSPPVQDGGQAGAADE